MINITKENWMSQDELLTLKTIFKDIKPQESLITSSSSSIQRPELEGPFSSSSDDSTASSSLTSSVSLADPSSALVVNLDKDAADYLNKLTNKGRKLLTAVLKRKDVEHIDLSKYFGLNKKSEQKEALKAIKTIQKLLMYRAMKPVINMGTRLDKLTNEINDANNNQDGWEFQPAYLNHEGKLIKFSNFVNKFSILCEFIDQLTDLMGSDDLEEEDDLKGLENLKTAVANLLQSVPKKERVRAKEISKIALKTNRLEIVKTNFLKRRDGQRPEFEGPFSSSTQGPKFQTSPESYIPHPFSSSSSSNGSSGSSAKTTFRTAGANEVAEIKHSAVYASFSYQNNPGAAYSLIINHRTKDDNGSIVRVHNPNARAYINLGRL
ncbi:hypothetical protein QPK87_32330, partial [Kamptonema cortianum]|nr:hypothetical protein [Kamptonema cortianum]